MATVLDSSTRVNLGILGAIISSAIGGSFWLATMNGNVEALCNIVDETRRSVQTLTATVAAADKGQAVIEQQQAFILQRLDALEKRISNIENRPR